MLEMVMTEETESSRGESGRELGQAFSQLSGLWL